MVVTAATRKPNTIEIFQDLNRQLAPNVQPIAKIGCTGGAARLIQLADQVSKRHNAIVTVITIFHDRNYQPLLRRVA